MKERERTDVFKCMTVTLALVQNLPFCVKRIATGPLATHQISLQSVQQFPRYGEGMHTCTHVQLYPPGTAARAHVPNINFCKALS